MISNTEGEEEVRKRVWWSSQSLGYSSCRQDGVYLTCMKYKAAFKMKSEVTPLTSQHKTHPDMSQGRGVVMLIDQEKKMLPLR